MNGTSNGSPKILSTSEKVEGTNDAADFEEVMEAMETMRIDENERTEIIKLVCAILHLGNIQFSEGNNDQSWIEQEDGRFFIFKMAFF